MTTNTLQTLLSEHVDEEALHESDKSLDSTVDMLSEALSEGAGVEQPTDGEFDHLQTYNQDYLAGLSKEDLDYLHPDNTADLNAESVATTTRGLQADQRDAVSSSLGESAPVSLLQSLVEGTDASDDFESDDEDFGLGDDDGDDDEDFSDDE